MKYLTIKPLLGTKNDCPINSPTLYQSIGENTFLTCDTGGQNFDLNREKDSCSKAFGRAQWSASANASATSCHGLFELYDGTNRNHIYFDKGVCYIFNSSRVPVAVTDAYLKYDAQAGAFTHGLTATGAGAATGVIVCDAEVATAGTLWFSAVTGTFNDNENITDTDTGDATVDGTLSTTTFATDNIDLYSIINFGGYMIFADRGEHQPFKWKHGDTYLTPLITKDAATQYKFRYLMHLANRIVGVYSDQTNGDLDIRYTDALPAWATLDFPAANQFYKPEGDAGLTGCAKLGHNTGYLFSEEDITRMDYSSSSGPVFTAIRILRGWGSVNHQAIVSDGINLYTFDKNRGFYKFNGVSEPIVISDDYEGMINRIPSAYYNLITGKIIPFTNEIAWNIPVDSDSTPSIIIFYNTKTGQWRHENKAARALDTWRTFSSMTWNDLIVLTDDVWPTQHTWSWYLNEAPSLVFGNSDGQLYSSTSEGDNASAWEGYRIEPVLPIADGKQFIDIKEIWLNIAEKVNASIDFYWRGGDTVGEVEQEAWTSIGSISMNSPDDPVIYPNKMARLPQIKWGTDLKSEPFSINEIRIGYEIRRGY